LVISVEYYDARNNEYKRHCYTLQPLMNTMHSAVTIKLNVQAILSKS